MIVIVTYDKVFLKHEGKCNIELWDVTQFSPQVVKKKKIKKKWSLGTQAWGRWSLMHAHRQRISYEGKHILWGYAYGSDELQCNYKGYSAREGFPMRQKGFSYLLCLLSIVTFLFYCSNREWWWESRDESTSFCKFQMNLLQEQEQRFMEALKWIYSRHLAQS